MNFIKALGAYLWSECKRSKYFFILVFVLFILFFTGWAYVFEVDDRKVVAPKDGTWVETPDLELYARHRAAIGERRGTIIFLHGMGAWSKTWDETSIATASRGYASLALDMPPFGFSERPNNHAFWRVDNAARLGVIVRQLPRPRYIVAHSYGSRAALEYIIKHDDEVDGVIFVDPAFDGIYTDEVGKPSHLVSTILSQEPIQYLMSSLTVTNPFLTKYFLKQFMHKKDMATDDVVALYRQPSTLQRSTQDFGAWLAGFLLGHDSGDSQSKEKVSAIQTPLVLIWGAEDTTTPLSEAHAFTQLLPNTTLMIMPGVGHMPHLESPAVFFEFLDNALASFALNRN
ncbi:MAG: hypothetical protein RI911_322 [Candidatus Parcubacteria bacterium]|jgi:pimeloyl-ACP methyl ester carboxylesterase